MDFIEYPKVLYRDGEYRQVEDAGHEEAARADGYYDYAADQARADAPADDEPAQTRKTRATKA